MNRYRHQCQIVLFLAFLAISCSCKTLSDQQASDGANVGNMNDMNGFRDLDESKADEYIGKTILIGVTYLDHKGNVIRQQQWFGRIKTWSKEKGIEVDLDDSDEFCCIPPSAGSIQKAKPGIYTLRSTGKRIENPDYVTTWTCQEPDPKQLNKVPYDDAVALYQVHEYEDAYKILAVLAEQGHAEAQNMLGILYREGLGVPKNSKEGIKWTKKAAEQGLASAQHKLGWIYAMGDGVEIDYQEAMKWYQKSAAQGDSDSQLNIGLMYVTGGYGIAQNYQEALKWFHKAADEGNIEACYHLGIMYSDGEGVEPDRKTGFNWYKKAADRGNVKSQFQLGMYYYQGKGVIQSYQEALKWFQKAAEQGYADAQFNLFVMYFQGQGVAQDLQKASEWLEKAAAQGQPDAVTQQR